MFRRNRRLRAARLAAFILTGAMVLQLGACFTMAAGTLTSAFNNSILLDENELFLGIFAPCGTPNVQFADANGNPTGDVFNTEDDLIFDCPITLIGP